MQPDYSNQSEENILDIFNQQAVRNTNIHENIILKTKKNGSIEVEISENMISKYGSKLLLINNDLNISQVITNNNHLWFSQKFGCPLTETSQFCSDLCSDLTAGIPL